jgi:hypothetical protein
VQLTRDVASLLLLRSGKRLCIPSLRLGVMLALKIRNQHFCYRLQQIEFLP